MKQPKIGVLALLAAVASSLGLVLGFFRFKRKRKIPVYY